ncbi:MAG: fused MFS/spermidine synthase [Pseudolabrys sp.]
MNTASLQPPAARLILPLYTASVFLSALLLFGVQPMFTRMVLPELGGSPAVWSVAMVFFQSMLLAGYAYAHWLASAKRRIVPVAVHLAVMVAAALMLPLSIAQGWGEPPLHGTEFWLLGLFTVSIGLPFFALAANNPLLQTWFVRSGHAEGKDPYFLYAASNVGSFLALLSYPLLLEPAFSLRTQGRLWSYGFVLLALLIAGCGALMLRAPAEPVAAHDAPVVAKPTWLAIGRWIFLSAVPSGLLIAVTSHISTDVAAMPLMWVMPLSLYLLTWVLVFARRPLLPQGTVLLLAPFAIIGIVALMLYGSRMPLIANLAAHLSAFFVIAMACHGELARARPPGVHLTIFYVSISFGGMVGGLFAGLVAPYAFSWIAEYPILAVLAMLCRPRGDAPWPRIGRWFWPVAAALGVALIAPSYLGYRISYSWNEEFSAAVMVLAALSLVLLRDPRKAALVIALAFAIVRLYPTGEGSSETLRSFFGVNQIYETADHRYRALKHGSTLHGAQMLLDEDGTPPDGPPEPITYYHSKSAMAQAIDAVRARAGGPLSVAVIGLGTGSLACYKENQDTFKFFEIDPTVVTIARDPKRFTFLESCGHEIPIVLGDARLTLAKEPANTYDLIIVDAYSSDAIPVHLATREAMAIYKSKLAPQGVVVMHISNRHLELQSVVVGIATANNLKSWVWSNDDEEEDEDNFVFTSDVVISAAEVADIGALAEDKLWVLTAPKPGVRTWTDDYSNIAGAFWRKFTR